MRTNKHKKEKKTLQELNLLDRFLFAEAAENREFLETVLEIILEDQISLKYPPQTEKEIRRGLRSKKIRLDVWDVDEEDMVYSVESQKENTGNLPKRSRYYQGLTDSRLLPEGTVDYNKLNDVIIILIAPFDLFGRERYRYTFSMMCEEELGVMLNDGATRIFLNTNGRNREGVSDELIEMLRYFEYSTADVADAANSERVRSLHNIVETIRNDEEVGVKFMNAMEEKILDRQEAYEEGEADGFKRGAADGRIAGFEEGKLASISDLMKNKGWSCEEAMEALGIEMEKRAEYAEKVKVR